MLLGLVSLSILFYAITSSASDGPALLSFKAEISNDPLQSLASWDEASLDNVCQWLGVTCNATGEPRVTGLHLNSLSLVGPISPVLANLSSLQVLYLQDNNLYGPIPPQLGSLLHLQHLNLSFNHLQGNIPLSLANLSSLATLSLSYNIFSGTFPPGIFNISSLTSITFEHCNLSGTIPHDIGYTLPGLEQLSLSKNRFSGLIPESLGALPNLTWVLLSANRLEISSWSILLAALANCSKLEYLLLSENNLGGVLPVAIGNLSARVEYLNLNHNQIYGAIPVEIGNLVGLTDLYLSFNTLTEYGWANKASKQGDVYSYGILLLEMFTGKAPIDDSFKEGTSLRRYVESAYPERVLEITDPQLFLECASDDNNNADDNEIELECDDEEEEIVKESRNMSNSTVLQECLVSVFRVGLFCTKESPNERMEMGDVTKELTSTNIAFLQTLDLDISSE